MSAETRLRLKNEKNLITYSFTTDSLQTFSLDVIIDFPLSFKDC